MFSKEVDSLMSPAVVELASADLTIMVLSALNLTIPGSSPESGLLALVEVVHWSDSYD